MKNFSKKKWKRILSMMLAVALVLGLCQTTAMVEAANDVSAIVYSTVPTNGTDTTAPNQELTLKLLDKEGNSINALGIDTNWDPRFKPKDDESGLYRNGTRVSSDSSAYVYAVNNNVVLYLKGDVIANAGDVFTVKGSLCDSTRNQTITFAKPQSYMWSGTEWIRIGDTSVKTLSHIYSGGYDDATKIYTKFEEYDESSISVDEWTNHFEPVNEESGLFIHSNGTTTRLTIDRDATRLIFQDGAGWGNGLYIRTQQTSDSLTVGDTLTIKGSFASPSTGESFRLQNEVTFTYNGTNWDITGETPYYADYITFTGTLSTTGAQTTSTNTTNIYLAGDSGLDEYKINSNDNWSLILSAMEGSENGIFLNGSKVDSANLRKYSDYGTWFFTEGFTASNAGDCLTIKGQFKDNTANKIVSINESSFVWDGSQWSDAPTATPVTYQDITLTGLAGGESGASGYDSSAERWRFYLLPSTTLPGTKDSTHFTGLKMSVGDGESFDITVNPTGYWNSFYFSVPSEQMAATLEDGTKIVIYAGKAESDDGSDGINLTEDFVLYVKDGKLTTVEPTVYTDFSITGFQTYTQYNDSTGNWNAYLIVDKELPGTAWVDRFNITITVGDTETTVTAMKGNNSKELYVSIPISVLPLETDQTVTIKAGTFDCNDSSKNIGYQISADYQFYASKHGWSVSDKILDANVLNLGKLVLREVQGDSTGFYLNTTEEDSLIVDGWNTRIYPVRQADSDNQTVYFTDKNGVSVNGEYQDVKMPLIKVGDKTFFTGLADVSITATTGDKYTVGGVFHDTDGNLMEFEPITVSKNADTDWGTTVVDTEIGGDVNGDGTVASRDLVRLLRYHRTEGSVAINEAQIDINGDGSVDSNDIVSLRKVLLGSICYSGSGTEGGNAPAGTPTYSTAKTVERMAYICPSAGTWTDGVFTANPTLDEELQAYKAAGFTLLNSEQAATLLDNNLDETTQVALVTYLNAAQRNGLGVIVYSPYIDSALRQADLANGAYSNWQAIVDLYLNFLNKYPAFKGFMVADELTIQYAENYKQIISYLKAKNPDLILHSSQLSVTAYNVAAIGPESLTTDTTTNNTKETAYKDYVENFGVVNGMYTFDMYPLIYSADKFFGTVTSSEYSVNLEWYDNLKWVSDVAKEKGFKTGVTIQSCKLSGTSNLFSQYERYAPTEKADIGFQVYTAMAYGAQEINYYTYMDHPTDTTVEDFIADNASVRSAVTSINEEIASFGNVFKAFTWKDTLDIADGGTNSSTGNARLASAASSGARALVGCMKDADGFDGYMVANADGPRAGKTATVTLTFNDAANVLVYKGTSCETVSLTDNTYVFELAAGEGAFVIPIRKNPAIDLLDFTVEVEEGRDIVVLQLTDPQIIDAAQARTENRLGEATKAYYATENIEERLTTYLTQTISAVKPDLILLTGDLIYGEFDDNGTAFQNLISIMDGFGIPWAPVFGNHDNESAKGVDWQCKQLENSEYCLFKQRELTGNGNYTVGIVQGGVVKRVFFMLDSNGCSGATNKNSHTKTSYGFGDDQIEWYTETGNKLKAVSPDTKISFAFHVPVNTFVSAYEKYGFTNSDTESNPINIDTLEDKATSDFGYLGANMGVWGYSGTVWKSIKNLGADSIFVGHEHGNSASVVYDGIRCQFGQKSSTYDKTWYMTDDGQRVGSYTNAGTPVVGGTVLPVSSEDGSIVSPYIYYCNLIQ